MKDAIRLSGVVFIMLSLSALFISCGPGDEENATIDLPHYWEFEIFSPTSASAFSHDCNAIVLLGTTNYPADSWKTVDIRWNNQTEKGLFHGTGTTHVSQCLAPLFGLYYCDPYWNVRVPLDAGDNVITITAVKSTGTVIGQDHVTIHKPGIAYSIKGRISNFDGTGIDDIAVRDAGTGRVAFTNSNGNFQLNCMLNGPHTLRPDSRGSHYSEYVSSNNMDWPFSPESRMVMVNDSDVTEQDFSTEVYRISGRVTDWVSDYYREGVADLEMLLSGPGNSSASVKTDADGYYSFLAPNGEYVIELRYYTYYHVYPDSINVTVAGGDVLYKDFRMEK